MRDHPSWQCFEHGRQGAFSSKIRCACCSASPAATGRDCAPHQPTMTGARSPPPLSPLRPDNPHRALHTDLLSLPLSSHAQVTGMLAGVERLRQVQQGAAARHAHELCGGHRLRSGEAVAAGGIARVR